MKYTFTEYGRSNFDQAFSLYSNLNNSLIIVDNKVNLNLCKEKLYSLYGLNNNIILTMSEFKENIFLSSNPFIRGYSRFIAFYKSLSDAQKKQFGIKNIFDSIPFSERFFSLYEELSESNRAFDIELQKWQKPVFDSFTDIKQSYSAYLEGVGYDDKIFRYDEKNINLDFVSNFDSILVFDSVYLSGLESAIFKTISKSFSNIEFFIQAEKFNYDFASMRLKSVEFVKEKMPKILVQEADSNFTQQSSILRDISRSNKLGLINVTNKSIPYLSELIKSEYKMRDSSLFKFLESIKLLIESVYSIGGQFSIKISSLIEAIESEVLSKYFNITMHDKESLATLAKSGYKYVPKGFGTLTPLFDEIEKIYKIDSFEEFAKYFKSIKFNLLNLEQSDIVEVYLNSIIELEVVGRSILSNKWKKIFHKVRLSNSLVNLLIISISEKRISLKEAGGIKPIKLGQNTVFEHLVMFNFNNYKISKKNFLLTAQQREKLDLRSSSNEIVARYHKVKSIMSSSFLKIYYIKDLESNIDKDPIINEIISFTGQKPNSLSINKASGLYNFFSSSNFTRFEEHNRDAMPIESDDLIGSNGDFSIGFYDYSDLTRCEYRYYLKSIAKIGSYSGKVFYRIDPNLLGNVVHHILNKVAEHKEVEVTKNNFKVDHKLVSEVLLSSIEEEKYKIPTNYSRYYQKVLFPFLIEGVLSFYEALEKRFPKEQILKFEIESSERRSFGQIDGINFSIKGKVDLRIETNKKKYIIDYKTGHSEPKQLDFYHTLYYDEAKNVYKWFYKFFDKAIKEETKVNITKEEIQESVSSFIKRRIYSRTENKSVCRFCEYVDVCRVKGN